uniref:Uncharacterized protein LOC114338900 n=1 Tax=Diabrotica virgifera virgifera TaxID=50390 RepID=A0A6P7GJE7_DIAVI
MESIPEGYEYSIINQSSFRIKLHSKEEVEKWVHDLEQKTKVTYRITKTFSVGSVRPVNIFKRIYHCHFNTRKEDTQSSRSRNTNCAHQMFIKIERKLAKPKLPGHSSLIANWPCVIEFKNDHNHTILSAAALRYRPIGDAAKNRFLELFEHGHNASSAYHTYCVEMMVHYGDAYDNYVSDRCFFPTKNDVQNLWKANFKKSYGERSGKNMLIYLEKYLEEQEKNHGILYKVSCVQDNYPVAMHCAFKYTGVSSKNKKQAVIRRGKKYPYNQHLYRDVKLP